ncbi:MAG: ubiquinone/menaquinone biosynthesis methyltransferase [Chloroflexi bacterium]|nr:ubiquinone/menaquinone biosynthesis methyltransferase [Chloroflexota bacterium]MDA1173054.1 ubiquinone/menaquinone biosynthesis methyltransferase [Chloroflexota bacterium]
MPEARRVRAIFDSIAPRYDRFNRIATLNRDQAWRARTARAAAPSHVGHALDVATGTGLVARELLDRADRVTGVDLSLEMLRSGEETNAGRVSMLAGDALSLPFKDASFDCATIGYDVRNTADPQRSLDELFRVLRPGGRVAVLDICRPTSATQELLCRTVFRVIVPMVGRLLAGKTGPYCYLLQSVDDFDTPDELAASMRATGFDDVTFEVLYLGLVTLHVGVKPS